jgi:catalase
MFDYVVQIAEPGDVTNDPTHYWPESRRTVNLGTLSISSIVPNSDEVQHKTLWDPARLTTGITLSDDQLPAIRSQAYAISFTRRLAS